MRGKQRGPPSMMSKPGGTYSQGLSAKLAIDAGGDDGVSGLGSGGGGGVSGLSCGGGGGGGVCNGGSVGGDCRGGGIDWGKYLQAGHARWDCSMSIEQSHGGKSRRRARKMVEG